MAPAAIASASTATSAARDTRRGSVNLLMHPPSVDCPGISRSTAAETSPPPAAGARRSTIAAGWTVTERVLRMLRKDAKIELLRQVTLFAGCSKRELAEIARIADEIDFEAGKLLIRQGEPGRQFYVIIDGAVEVERDGEVLPRRGGSEFFGEISLVSGVPATATVTTT